MSDPFEGKDLPKGVLWATGAFLLATLAVTYYARHTDTGRVESEVTERLEVRTLRFADGDAGEVLVFDSAATQPFLRIESGQDDGFVRGVLRGLMRGRRARSVSPDAPFDLVLWAGGRVSLEDLATGEAVDLNGFGATNLRAFLAILRAPPLPGPPASTQAEARP